MVVGPVVVDSLASRFAVGLGVRVVAVGGRLWALLVAPENWPASLSSVSLLLACAAVLLSLWRATAPHASVTPNHPTLFPAHLAAWCTRIAAGALCLLVQWQLLVRPLLLLGPRAALLGPGSHQCAAG